MLQFVAEDGTRATVLKRNLATEAGKVYQVRVCVVVICQFNVIRNRVNLNKFQHGLSWSELGMEEEGVGKQREKYTERVDERDMKEI